MKAAEQREVGIVLLAAGQASRMGMPKQLLVHQKEPLILHITNLLLSLDHPVCVVLGSRHRLIMPVLEDLPVQTVINENWESGMGTSLQAGLQVFRNTVDGILFCVVDQPYLTKELLLAYLHKFQTIDNYKQSIITARYSNNRLGVPALFGSDWFDELSTVAPAEGARKIIRREKDRLHVIDFPKGNFDLDRPEDWEKFREK